VEKIVRLNEIRPGKWSMTEAKDCLGRLIDLEETRLHMLGAIKQKCIYLCNIKETLLRDYGDLVKMDLNSSMTRMTALREKFDKGNDLGTKIEALKGFLKLYSEGYSVNFTLNENMSKPSYFRHAYSNFLQCYGWHESD
jgi:hypothetical protein